MNKPLSPALQPAHALAAGLVRCYTFHEGSGQTLHDLAAGASDATTRIGGSAAALSWASDSTQGPYLPFNGTDQDATATDAGLPTGAAPRTVAWLARASEYSQSTYGYYLDFLFGYGAGGDAAFSAGLGSYGNGDTSLRVRVTTPAYGAGGTADLRDGQWHLCAVTILPGPSLQVFVDGVQSPIVDSAASTPTTDPFPIRLDTNLAGTLYLGRIAGGEPFYFKGDVAGIWAWDRALSPSEIASFSADPWEMVRTKDLATGYTLAASPGSVLTGSAATITATLSGGSALSSPLVITLAPAEGVAYGGPITINPGQSAGSTTATASTPGTKAIAGSHTGGGFIGGDGSTTFVAEEPIDPSTYRPYGEVFNLLAAGRSAARARAIAETGVPFAGLDWSTAGVRELGSGQYGVTLLLPPVPLWIQVDDGAGGPSLFDRWDGGGAGASPSAAAGPTAEQIAAAVLSRSFSGAEPGNSIAGILGALPTLDEYRAEIAGQIASTPAMLPATPPAAYATAANQATAAAVMTSIQADTTRLAGLVETTMVDGTPVDRFKFAALVQAPTGSAPVTPDAIVAAINAAGVRLRADGLDAIVVEAGINARQALAIDLAASAGTLAGAGSGLITIKGAGVADTRITAATDQSGNRIRVQMDLPD